ncbi:PRA1 family protein 3 [Venturia canescens]|uniref:PRA1 family protein 3 n=1 Tax=Venturia canescens TaxID=32260 RepID=UPI001C9C8243|nr:PRA1 family protein 3 [Venturia canescens]
MDKTKLGSTGLELPPLRTLDDFLFDSARFQLPNLKNIDKWGNRVVNNLLYYQTNYFFMSVIIFLVVGFIHPGQMFVGMIAMAVALVVFAYFSTEGRTVHNFKRQYPAAGPILILCGSGFVTYTLGSLLVFLLGILLPFCVTFIHSSLRLRHLKNKVVNKIESLGVKRSPMGVLLEYLDDVTCMNLRPQTNIMFKMPSN